MLSEILLGTQLICTVCLFLQIKKENKEYQQTSIQLQSIKNNPQPLSPSDIYRVIRNLHDKQQFLKKGQLTNAKNQLFFQYSPNEILFQNVYIAGITDTCFPIIPKNQQYAYKNLLFSQRIIQRKGRGIYDSNKIIEQETKYSPVIKLSDAEHSVEVQFPGHLNISYDEFDYNDVRGVVNMIKPQQLYKIVLKEQEIGVGLGGILSVFGDIIYNIKDKSITMQNAKYVGFGSKFLYSEIQNQKLMQEAALLGSFLVAIGSCAFIIYEGFQIYKKWKKYKADKLKQVYFVNYDNNSIKCKKCQRNLKNIINIPCLHLEQCKQCFDYSEQTKNILQTQKCTTCNQKISDFQPIFLV